MNRHRKKNRTIFLLLAFVLLSNVYSIRAEQTNTRSTIARAHGLAKKRKCPDAVALLEKVFKETKDTELLLELADVYCKMKQKDRAVRTLDDLIDRIRSQDEVTLYDRDLYEKARARLSKLCPNRKKLRKINDSIVKQSLALAKTRMKRHDLGTLQKTLAFIDRLDPRNPEVDRLRDRIPRNGISPKKWMDLTRFSLLKERNSQQWFAVNSFPRVDSRWIKAMKNTRYFTKGRKWFIMHPNALAPGNGYGKRFLCYTIFRCIKPITEIKFLVAVAHPDKGSFRIHVRTGGANGDGQTFPIVNVPSEHRRPVEYRIVCRPATKVRLEIQSPDGAPENIVVVLDPMIR